MPWKDDLNTLINYGEYLPAFDLLKKVMAYTKDTYASNTLVMMSAAYHSLERKKMQGTMREEDLSREHAKLNYRVLEFAKRFDDFEFDHGIPLPGRNAGGASQPAPDEGAESSHKRILFLAFNPPQTAGLDVKGELLEVMDRVEKGTPLFQLKREMATTTRNLQESLITIKPNILHLSGHGTFASEGNHEAGLILDDGHGKNRLVEATDLGELIEIIVEDDPIDLILINACESVPVAEEFAKNVDYVIGMAGKIEDRSAITFSSAFYLSLAAGHDVPKAFKLARNQLKIDDLQGPDLLRLLGRKV